MEERFIIVDLMIIFCQKLSVLIKFLFIIFFFFILTCNPHPNIKSSGKDIIKTIAAKEKIVVKKFVRFKVGEGV